MTNKQERFVLILMSINALAFVVMFLLVASKYRLAADDYHHAYMVSQHGIWDTMVYYYNNWNPRWSSILVTNIFLSKPTEIWPLFLFHCCSLLLGFVSVWSLLNGLRNRFQLPFKKLHSAILSIYLVMAVFYASFSKTDTWFWITVNPMYLWGTFAAILGGSFLLQNWNPLVRYLLTVLTFLYVGGSSESAALTSLVVLIFLGFITKKSAHVVDRKALHLATIFCILGFGIAMAGNGIQIRREHLPHYPISDRLLVGLWNYIKFNLYQIPQVLPIVILAVAPFGFFGRKHLRFQLISVRDVFWSNRKLWAVADLTIVILAMALGWVMCEMGPYRTWFPITILVVTISVALAYQLGSWVYIISKGRLFELVVVAQILLMGFQAFQAYVNIPRSMEYAAAHDSRTRMVSNQIDNPSSIRLVPLPNSGWLLSGDISSDTTHFTNQHLKLYFGLEQAPTIDSTLTSGL